MEFDLEVFLKAKGYYTKFRPFIKTKTSITEVKKEEIGDSAGEIPKGKPIKYEFKGDIDKIISEFLDKNPELAKSFEKNEKAERCYLKSLPNRVKKYKKFDRIYAIFNSVFTEKSSMGTSVIKQYERRYQQRIHKDIFCEDQVELINIGVFFLMIEYYLAKQRKIMNQKDVVKSDLADSSTKKTKLSNVIDNPVKVTDWGDTVSRITQEYAEPRYGYCETEFTLLRSYYSDGNQFGKALPKTLDTFYQWAQKNADSINRMSQFKEEVQKGPHEILVTHNNNGDNDPFVNFMLNNITKTADASMLLYPYFFEGSEEKELVVNGKKSGVKGYSFPKGLSLNEAPTKDCLDKKLKPIWFRDITKENKRYKKMSMKELHETASSYFDLLDNRTIKYISVEYKCERDRILVSFKTNHFDVPPKFLKEDDFKKLFSQNSGTVLYRGMKELKNLETLKEKRLSSIINKYVKRTFGTGLYWSKSLEIALCHGNFVVMGVAVDHISDAAKHVLHEEVAEIDVYLMKDNQAVFIREKAMYDARRFGASENLKKRLESAGVLVCETDEEVNKWVKCE